LFTGQKYYGCRFGAFIVSKSPMLPAISLCGRVFGGIAQGMPAEFRRIFAGIRVFIVAFSMFLW